MKSMFQNTIKAVLLIAGVLACNSQAEVSIINLGGASLPREQSPQGQSWTAASANWMQLLRTRASVVGTNRDQALLVQDLGDYGGMIATTTFNSWKAVAETSGPTVEWGNAHFEGVQFLATNGDTFLPQNATVNVQSFSRNGSGVFVLGATNMTATMNTLNYFRQRLDAGTDGVQGTSDDVVSTTQSVFRPPIFSTEELACHYLSVVPEQISRS